MTTIPAALVIFLTLMSNRIIIVSSQSSNGTFNNARIKVYQKPTEQPSATITVNGNLDLNVLPDEYEKIEMVNQGISVLRANALTEITVNQLIFTDNGMTDIEENAFVDLEAVKILDLSNNLLAHIRVNTVSKLITLDRLILSFNKINKIDKRAFKNLQVTDMELENNELTEYDPEWFNRNNKNLRKINLKRNRITHIPRDSFKYFEKIDAILLQENLLTSIDMQAFLGVHQLGTLDLSSNLLKELDPNLFRTFNGIADENADARRFADMPSMHVSFFSAFTGIHSLYIHNNSFTYLPTKLLRDVRHNLRYINIHSNPWQCACYREIEAWAAKSSVSINVFDIGCIHYDNPVCVVPSQNGDKCIENDVPELYDIYDKNSIKGFNRSDQNVHCF